MENSLMFLLVKENYKTLQKTNIETIKSKNEVVLVASNTVLKSDSATKITEGQKLAYTTQNEINTNNGVASLQQVSIKNKTIRLFKLLRIMMRSLLP